MGIQYRYERVTYVTQRNIKEYFLFNFTHPYYLRARGVSDFDCRGVKKHSHFLHTSPDVFQ